MYDVNFTVGQLVYRSGIVTTMLRGPEGNFVGRGVPAESPATGRKRNTTSIYCCCQIALFAVQGAKRECSDLPWPEGGSFAGALPVINGIETHSIHARAILIRFLFIAIPLGGLFFAIGIGYYYTESKLTQIKRESDETHGVRLAQEVISKELRGVLSDLEFLTKLNELRTLIDEPGNKAASSGLAQEFLYFSEKKRIYDQIRVLDTLGMEIIRINYNEGFPTIIAQDELQNKASRYYFHEALSGNLGDVYMSPFDLNIEGGEIVKQLNPVIRFSTPLFDSAGNKKGLLLVNFMGNNLVGNFKRAAADIAGHMHLMNVDGYWLSSPRPEDEWGFMLDHGRSFKQSYPEAWLEIITYNAGSFYNDDGLFTFSTVYPVKYIGEIYPGIKNDRLSINRKIADNSQSRFWKIVSYIPSAKLGPTPLDFFKDQILLFLTTGLFVLTASLILAQTGVRRRLERKQKEYEHRFRETLETIQLAAVTLNTQGIIIFCNDYLLSLTGWSRDILIGRNWFETFLPEQERTEARELFQQMITGNTPPPSMETHIKTDSGETLLLAWNNTLSHASDGRITALTSIGEDITEQRWNEEQLRKLSLAVEQSTNPILITDTDGMIEYVNRKFTQLTGYTAEEVIGRRSSILKSGETSDEEYRILWETIMSGREWRGLFHNRKKNGELYWEYTAISPIRDASGMISNFLAVKEDVTELKRLESEVEERNRELDDARIFAVVGRMATMIAHDLRNPLSSVKMTLQILGKRKMQSGAQDANELKDIALEQVRYMENILADILQYSRPDALKSEWVSVNKLVDMALAITQKTMQEYGAKVITELESQLPTIHGDSTKLRQVFSNLIMNALQSTEDINRSPEILIRTRLEVVETQPRLKVEVYDNGSGIDPAIQDKLFEPFFTTRAKGTGLGLPIVKRIIEQHRGMFTLEPAEGGGTCAAVSLPTQPIDG